MFFSFHFLGREIPLYGICIVLGGGFATLAGVMVFRRQGWKLEDLILAETLGIAGGFLGAKLLYLAVSWRTIDWHLFFRDLEYMNFVLGTGFVFYGGLIGSFAGLLFVWKVWHIPVTDYLDKVAFCIPLAHGFGRIGCFLGGCCYGIPYDGPFSVVFPESNPYTLSGVPLFPVQLLEAAILFLLSLVLYFRAKKDGRPVFIEYILLYAIARFLIEFLRYDDEARGIWGVFSTSQWISLLLAAGSLLYLLCSGRKSVSTGRT